MPLLNRSVALVIALSGATALQLHACGARAWSQAAARPQGWDARTHGDRAAPDYGLFALDRVHDVHIVISADNYRRMQDDLGGVVPMLGMMRGLARGDSPAGNRPNAGAPPGRGGGLTARDPEYVPVTVRHDGHEWAQVGMRYKGNYSLMMSAIAGGGKISFRLNFDRYEDTHPEVANQRFYGFKELTFSSNFGDDSQVREALANEMFRDRGVPAPRVAFYRVSVDTGKGPELWGLYTMVEDPADGAMLRSQFGGAGGNLYKPDGPGADWTRFDEAGFEKKNNRNKPDFTDIAGAIAALHAAGPSPQWRANLERRLDVDHFLRWLAVNQVVDNWDAYGRFAHNYYLYADPARNGRLVWIPWDNNYSFGGTPFGVGSPLSPVPGFPLGLGDDVFYERVGGEWPLISRLMADETYRARYRAHLTNALGGLYAPETLNARIRAWHQLIASTVAREAPGRTTVSSPQNFQRSIDALIASVDRRRSTIKAALGR